jgi:hypothetical protein
MSEQIKLVKETFGRNTYTKVVDTKFTELYVEQVPTELPQVTVEEFFTLYNDLFFEIPATGQVNSHEYLVKRSLEYLGGPVVTDAEQAYIDEINALRQQLLEANQNYLNLNNIV